MTAKYRNITVRLTEATIVVLYFSVFVHLLTSHSAGLANVIAAGVMVIIAVASVYKCFGRDWNPRWYMLALLSASAGGFWVFSLLRCFGFTRWPLAYAANLTDYAVLFYSHFVLSTTVLMPLLLMAQAIGSLKTLSWGKWKSVFPPYGRPFLLLVAAGCWFWASYVILSTDISASGSMIGFIIICLLKALLTGATEEICYRGVIQPAAITHFGIPLGIVLQSCLYAAFHMHLGVVFSSQAVFLAGVMVLGLVFGIVTHLTSGIFWAVIIHVAINVVIEWRNLS